MGYSSFWVGACSSRCKTAGFAAAPVAGHLSDRMGRKSVMMTSMRYAVVLVFMALAGKSLAFVFFVAVLGFFLYAIRAGPAGVAPREHARGTWGESIGVALRRAGARLLDRAAPRRAGRRQLRSDRDLRLLAGTIVAANLLHPVHAKTGPATA